MYRIYFIAILLCIASLPSSAQIKEQSVTNSKGCPCGFQSILQGGLLEGMGGSSWNLQTINGAYYKSWFAGIGIGLDYYSMRTIPLFIDARKELFRKKSTPFLYGDAGIHFDWLKKNEKRSWGTSEYNRGFFYDAGAGYKFGFGNRNALLLSAGYTMKTIREERMLDVQCIQAPCNPQKEYFNYTFSRFSFKVGWQFR